MINATDCDMDEIIEVPQGDGTIDCIRLGDATWAELEAHLEFLKAREVAGKLDLQMFRALHDPR